MKYKNLILIGTSHIASESVKEVKETIEKEKPAVVAIELDKKRLGALFSKQGKTSLKMVKHVGVKGFLFSMLGSWFQKKLGKQVNIEPGAEMKAAVKAAKKEETRIALIDQDIEATLMKFSKALSWKEKLNFFVDILKGIFFKKKVMKEYGLEDLDLTKVPSKKLIKRLIKGVKKRYPNVYKVLIEDRNKIMARKLDYLMKEYPDDKIIAVVGAGHEEEIISLIKEKTSFKPDITYSFELG